MPQGVPDIPYGRLNDIKSPAPTNPEPDSGAAGTSSFFKQSVIATNNQAKTNALDGVSTLKAIVLRVEQSSEKPATDPAIAHEEHFLKEDFGITDFKKMIRFRGYIPELFPYPKPTSFSDDKRINKFPLFSAVVGPGKEEPSPGDIVLVTFENMESLSGGIYLGMAQPAAGAKKTSGIPGKCPPPKVASKGPKGRIGGSQGTAAHTGIKHARARLRITPRRCVIFGAFASGATQGVHDTVGIGSKIEHYLFSKGWTMINDEGTPSDIKYDKLPTYDDYAYSIQVTGYDKPLSWWITPTEPYTLGYIPDQAPDLFEQGGFGLVRKALRSKPDLVVFSFEGFGDYVAKLASDPKTKNEVPGVMLKTTAQFVTAVRREAGDCVILIIAPYKRATNDKGENIHKTLVNYGPKGEFLSSYNSAYMQAVEDYQNADPKLMIIDPYDHSMIEKSSASINSKGETAIEIAIVQRLSNEVVGGINLGRQLRTSEAFIKPPRPPKRRKKKRKIDRTGSNAVRDQLKGACRMLGSYSMVPKKHYNLLKDIIKKHVEGIIYLAPGADPNNPGMGDGGTPKQDLAARATYVQNTALLKKIIDEFNASSVAAADNAAGAKEFAKKYGKNSEKVIASFINAKESHLLPHWESVLTRKFTSAGAGFIPNPAAYAIHAKGGSDPIVQGMIDPKKSASPSDLISKASSFTAETQPYGTLTVDELKSFTTAYMKSANAPQTAQDKIVAAAKAQEKTQKLEKAKAEGGRELAKAIYTQRCGLKAVQARNWAEGTDAPFALMNGKNPIRAIYEELVDMLTEEQDGTSREAAALGECAGIAARLHRSNGAVAAPRYPEIHANFPDPTVNIDSHGNKNKFVHSNISLLLGVNIGQSKGSKRINGDSARQAAYKIHNFIIKQMKKAKKEGWPWNYHLGNGGDLSNEKVSMSGLISKTNYEDYFNYNYVMDPLGDKFATYQKEIFGHIVDVIGNNTFKIYTEDMDETGTLTTGAQKSKNAFAAMGQKSQKYDNSAGTSGNLKFDKNMQLIYAQSYFAKEFEPIWKTRGGGWIQKQMTSQGSPHNYYHGATLWRKLADYQETTTPNIPAGIKIALEHTFATMLDIVVAAYDTAAAELGPEAAAAFAAIKGGAATSGITTKGIDHKKLRNLADKSAIAAKEEIQNQILKLIEQYHGQRTKESDRSKPTATNATDPCSADGGFDEIEGNEVPMTLGDPLPPNLKAKCGITIIAKKRFMNVRKRPGGKAKGICIHESASHGTGAKTAAYLAKKGYGVHFVVERNGGVYQHNPASDRLVHGGKANNLYIGVEVPSIFSATDKSGLPWTRKGSKKGSRVWRYPGGFITPKIVKAYTGKVKAPGLPSLSGGTVSEKAKTFGRRGFIFNPRKQCEAFVNLCTCMHKNQGIAINFLHGKSNVHSLGSANVNMASGGIVPHTRVPGTSHGDGRFMELYARHHFVKGLRGKECYYAAIGSMLRNDGTLNNHAKLGKSFVDNFPGILKAVYGGDVDAAIAISKFMDANNEALKVLDELTQKKANATVALAKKAEEEKKKAAAKKGETPPPKPA